MLTGAELAHGYSQEEAAAISALATEQVREQISGRANYLDDRTDALTGITRDCPGTVTMRAKTRGSVIQVTFCMNEDLTGLDGDIEPASVTRRSL